MQTKTKAVAGIGALLLLAAAAGCAGYQNPRGIGDAPVGRQDTGAANVIVMPDGFGNVATKCDGFGHRVYVVTHAKTDAPVTVIADPSCPGGKAG